MKRIYKICIGIGIIVFCAGCANDEVWQATAYCDCKQPCASGKMPREGYVANNWLPFGTKIKINNKEYVVMDRGSKREFGSKEERRKRVDIWMPKYNDCMQFGRQNVEVKI